MPQNSSPIPKHAIGDARPDGPEFIARLRQPFLLAQVETIGHQRIRLHCWPPDYAERIPPGTLSRSLSRLVDYYARTTHQPIPEFQAIPANSPHAPPPCLLLDNHESAWTGILQPHAPRLWEVDESEAPRPPGTGPAVEITWLPAFSGPAPAFPADTRATSAFYADYSRAEIRLEPPPALSTAAYFCQCGRHLPCRHCPAD
jgi:hypothetical protein